LNSKNQQFGPRPPKGGPADVPLKRMYSRERCIALSPLAPRIAREPVNPRRGRNPRRDRRGNNEANDNKTGKRGGLTTPAKFPARICHGFSLAVSSILLSRFFRSSQSLSHAFTHTSVGEARALASVRRNLACTLNPRQTTLNIRGRLLCAVLRAATCPPKPIPRRPEETKGISQIRVNEKRREF
jgi:hypothetical protein